MDAEFLNEHVEGCLRRLPDAAVHSLLHIEDDAGIVTHRADLDREKRRIEHDTGHIKTGHDERGQNRTGHDRTGQDRIRIRSGYDRTGRYWK